MDVGKFKSLPEMNKIMSETSKFHDNWRFFVEISMIGLFSKEVRVIVSIISERIYKNSNNGNKMTGDTLSNLSETFTNINNKINSLNLWCLGYENEIIA